MKTVILGLGNPILGDDGVGLRVAALLRDQLNDSEVAVTESSLAGLSLLPLLAGYDRAILIDAIQTRSAQAGEVYRLEIDELNTTRRSATSHDVTITGALELGRRLGMALPEQVVVFAIEVAEVSSFSDRCTASVERAIPVCAEMVIQELTSELEHAATPQC